MIPESEWKWLGTPGHLIVANRCCFRLHTIVGKYKISTVGCYHSNEDDDELDQVGPDRHFETLVFDTETEEIVDMNGLKIDSANWGSVIDRYHTQASQMHLEMCRRYAEKEPKK